MREPLQSALTRVDVLGLVADSVICTDADGRILVFNEAAERSFGYDVGEVIGEPVEMLLPQDERAEHARQVHDFGMGAGPNNRLMGHRREVRGRRKDGEEFPAEAMVSRHSIDGNTILTVVLRDITERKELESLREAVAQELSHRMKNVLSVVNSLVSLSAANAADVEGFRESLTGRLAALAATQNALNFGERPNTRLREILLAELAQYQTPDGANLTIDGPPVLVGAKAAQILGLAIHELATNSAKYGALRNPRGHVAITAAYQGEGDAQLVIQWQERGGPPVTPPTRTGFGTAFIEQIVKRSLRAKVVMDYRPEGLVCRMTMPRSAVEAVRHD